MHLLIVCTANRCRSPIAAAFVKRAVAPGAAVVASRGLEGAGEAMPALGASLMARRGFDLSDHRSQLVTLETLAEADLVLGMERRHVRRIVAWSSAMWPRTFTLKDFVRRAEVVGPVPSSDFGTAWLEDLGRDRRRTDLLDRSDAPDEVRDPFGRSASVWTSVIDELEDLTGRLTDILAPRGVQGWRPPTP